MLVKRKHISSSVVVDALNLIFKIVIALVAFALQIAVYVFVFLSIYSLWYLQIIVSVFGLIVVIRINYRDINIGYKISWSFFILLLPVIFTVLYFAFGGKRCISKKRRTEIDLYLKENLVSNDNLNDLSVNNVKGYKMAKAVYNDLNFPVYSNTATKYYENINDKHKELLADLANAEKYIFIEYFIASDGYVLNTILDVLEKKGLEGVEIKFIFDDVGSLKHLRGSTKKRIAKIPNMMLCIYEPVGIRINPRINYRDHRKIVVVDGKIGYIGGDNLADEYVGRKVKYGIWRDNAMRIEGDAVYSLVLLFAEVWAITANQHLDISRYKVDYKVEGNGYVMPFGDGPTNSNDPAYELFTSMINNADRYLYISTPYFILDDCFMNNIALAVKSGVDVKILVPHIPDKKITFALTRSNYKRILKAGGKIYEYTKGFNHAKNIIADDRYGFIGTVNCDYRSMFLHFECGALLVDNTDILEMRDDFLAAVAESEEITLEKWKKRPFYTKMLEVIFNFVSPMF